MSDELTPLLKASIAFAYVGGFTFVTLGLYLSLRRGRLHPLLLVCISAISFSWLEAPYDWAMYAQFPAAIPRMPSWWPMNMTWGGLPSSVPPGYIAYFVLPAVVGAAPHLVTKLSGEVTAGPTDELFEGQPNQPLHGRSIGLRVRELDGEALSSIVAHRPETRCGPGSLGGFCRGRSSGDTARRADRFARLARAESFGPR